MSEIPRGAIRFNTDSHKPELWDGSQWAEFQLSTPNLGTAGDIQPGVRGVFMGGLTPSVTNRVDYVNIESTGNAIDFGNLTQARYGRATASRTRALCGSGQTPGYTDRIDFITIASTGDATDFGNQSVSTFEGGATGNETRGLFAGGYGPSPLKSTDTIDYVTIASTGNAVDFGNLTFGGWGTRGCGSPTRGMFGSGYTITPGSSPIVVNNIINFVTIASTGDAQDFGDLAEKRAVAAAASNAVRGVWMGGTGTSSPYAAQSDIQYVTIASMGNASLFGDLANAMKHNGACSSRTRALSGGSPSSTEISYIEIMTTGDSVDFGDLSEARYGPGGTSNGHGGL